jgi:hypothetical protein
MRNQSGIVPISYTEIRGTFRAHLENRILFCCAVIFLHLFERGAGI